MPSKKEKIGMIIGLVILGIFLIIGFFVIRQIKLITMNEIVMWYVTIDPNHPFFIPDRIKLLRKRIGNKTFNYILKAVDKERCER